ncbi:flagellar motor protein MotB [Thalassotalea euphylliae]|uniref:Flagellar motor protein MotB n=1 Tax=Thalassotalea euphylliae TaxID=1655234 RepID=A0A3E0UB49_9GAMM|nr:flagellar motor protein MotB [Thalassotalea euphylliae]REL31036.1 flagellar motor protein MotB [Thalassotalea euphylliae]REL34060.1 flagellar motor protein MotB [Thalassotalea euphylliae]
MEIPELLHQQDDQPSGSPAWMATFADLMSLLMCFFVLLLSYSEMDVLKFKQIAGSMKMAFGVQNQIELQDIPKGTSIIAQEFSPGEPTPSPINTITQHTIAATEQSLKVTPGDQDASGLKRKAQEEAAKREQEAQLKRINQQLAQYIEDGALETEALGQQIIIRIKENGAFASGSPYLQAKFKPVVMKIAETIEAIPGHISISGHTDNLGVASDMYASNFDLSAQRALAVAHQMAKSDTFDSSRTSVTGHGSNRPLVPNSTKVNRRKNRRVEIAILQGEALTTERINLLSEAH